MLAAGNTIYRFIIRRLRSSLYPSALMLLLSAGSVFAQQKVSVRVTDQTGASIRNAQVTLVSTRGESASSLTADADGLVAVPCSTGSQIQVRALGFETRVASVSSCGQEIAIRLAPASVETTINVTVTADTAPNEPTATSSSISRTTARTVMDAVEDLSPAIFVTRRGVMGYAGHQRSGWIRVALLAL